MKPADPKPQRNVTVAKLENDLKNPDDVDAAIIQGLRELASLDADQAVRNAQCFMETKDPLLRIFILGSIAGICAYIKGPKP